MRAPIRPRDIAPVPWANGLGTTRVLVAEQAGTPLWRISLAEVTTDCAFSHFPGLDRISIKVSGPAAVLTVAGMGVLSLPEDGSLAAYPGEAAARCAGPGPVRLLNVMTWRGRATASAALVTLDGASGLDTGTDAAFAWCLDGSLACGGAGIGPGEAAHGEAGLVLSGAGRLCLVRLSAPGGGAAQASRIGSKPP
ncbi:HutD family protein [Dankookia sp. GCM10030260]|uniref:HutD/Ves family protein n=1 Tax=Dankookia sp. GCM10030260 TaxID=3273390 RepID=UPI003615538F